MSEKQELRIRVANLQAENFDLRDKLAVLIQANIEFKQERDDLRRQLNTLEKELEQFIKATKEIVKEVNNPDAFNVPTPKSRLGKAINELITALKEATK